jgi:hypothetical protein
MPWYKQGYMNGVTGSNAIVGVGTQFVANTRVGDGFRGHDGRWYEITNIASNTALSIDPAYQGPTVDGGVYAVAPMQGYVKDSADQLRGLVNQYGAKLAALGTTGNYDILPVSKGGTGGTDQATARGALGAAKSGDNSDILSLSGMTTALSIAQGGTGGKTQAAARAALGLDDFWSLQPIGVPIPVYDHYGGAAPSTTNPLYRYIKLTASDAYNSGLLTGESVSGSAPLVIATATLSLAGSPINGAFISLINTERRVIRAGASGTAEQDSLQGHGHRQVVGTPGAIADSGATGVGYDAGASSNGFGIRSSTGTTGNDLTIGVPILNGANGSPRVSAETRAKSMGATFYMRVK